MLLEEKYVSTRHLKDLLTYVKHDITKMVYSHVSNLFLFWFSW